MGNNDAKLLNKALGLEQFAIAAYEGAIKTGLLGEDVIQVARTFQSHHGKHVAVIRETILKLGEEPVKPLSQDEYFKQLPSDKLTDQEAIIRYALKLEKGAAIAYLGTVSEFENRKIAQAAASILGDEAMHWAALRQALGMIPVHISFIPLSEDEIAD